MRLSNGGHDNGNGKGFRDGGGRFLPGHGGGPGNPHANKVQALRTALFKCVGEDDVQAVVRALVREAKKGNVLAAREFLTRVLGAPEAMDVLARIESLHEDATGRHAHRITLVRGARGALEEAIGEEPGPQLPPSALDGQGETE